MKRDIRVYIEDVLESIERIEEYTGSMSEDNFYDNVQAQDAVLRRLEVIGEAVKQIPEDFRDKHPSIPWKKIAGMRDVLIHGYFGVNLKRVWKAIREEIPDLRQKLILAKKDLKGGGE